MALHHYTLTLPSPTHGLISSSHAVDCRHSCTHLAFKSHVGAGVLGRGDIDPCGQILHTVIHQTMGCTSELKVFACKPPGSRPQSRRQQFRRRRLKQEDPVLKVIKRENYWEPFIERHIRRVKDQGIHINDDVERLKLQKENKFELILELAEEANEFLVNHPEEAIHKKPALKVISDAVNQSGFAEREDAYVDSNYEFLEELGMF